MNETGQSKFEGWCILEIFGHSRAAGYTTTEYFGPAAMFRVEVPELTEREYTLPRPGYIEGNWIPAGAKVKRPMSPARSELVSPGAIFRMHPCTEEVAIAAIEEIYPRPLILLSMPPDKQITGPSEMEECGCQDEDCPSHQGICVRMTPIGEECTSCREYHQADGYPL